MEDKIPLASGDFSLRVVNDETLLTAVCPAPARQVSEPGDPEGWSLERWDGFLAEAGKFNRDDLLKELEELRESVVKKRISGEDPVFDDDAGEKPKAVHSLYVHYSTSDHVAVKGTSTYEHRKVLVGMGLRWSPENREWRADYNEELLKTAVEYVRENDTAYDPGEIGYERCGECGGWKLPGKHCSH